LHLAVRPLKLVVVWHVKLEAFDRSVLSTSIGDFNIGFPGQYRDAEKQSWYNYFRDYDATTGRYLQSDPIGLSGGLNTYAYVENNPLVNEEPLGLSRWLGVSMFCTGYSAGSTFNSYRNLSKGAEQLASLNNSRSQLVSAIEDATKAKSCSKEAVILPSRYQRR